MSRSVHTRLFLLLCSAFGCWPAYCQDLAPTKRHAVLTLVLDQPIRPFAQDLLEGIQEATRDAIGVSLFVEFLGPTALESETVAAQRRQLLVTKYAAQPIEVVVAIGDRTIPLAEKLREDLFPSAKLLFVTALSDFDRTSIRQGEGLYIDHSPWQSVQVVFSLLPKKSRLIVISGTTQIDQALRKSVADSLHLLPRKIEATYLNGVPLPELVERARQFPADSIVALTSNMVDRSGRATTQADLAREISGVGKVPVIEGSDLSLGYGALGGDLVSYRLAGQDIGRRIRRTLDTGQAPAGVVIDRPPRRKAFDWRQMERFGIAETRVPAGSEILYRRPTLWEEHRNTFLIVAGALILQALLISFLLTERRRRAETQNRMQRQLNLEGMVSKTSAEFSTVAHDEIPARLSDISIGLSACLGIERAIFWIYIAEKGGYTPVHWWPESDIPADRLAQKFPSLQGQFLAGKALTAVRLGELPPSVAPDITELKELGFRSVAMMPLMLGEEPIGALLLGTVSYAKKWESEVVSTLQVLASIVAQGISRSRSEERVRRSEEQNRAMLASLPGFVVMIDGGGQILRQNNRLELSEADLPKPLARACVGQNLLDLWREDGDSGSHIALVLTEIVEGYRTSLVTEHRYQTDRGTRWIEIYAESLSGEERGAVVAHTDITERKKKESENAQNRQTVWHLNRVAALGELTASLAHEINQPLAAILNSAEAAAVLLKRPAPDITETLEAVRDIIDDDKRAGAVISRMRSMLKRGQERTQPVSLSATVEETLRLVVNEARLRHVTLRHIATPDLPPVVADPTQLQQVILNLISNGIEAVETMTNRRQVEIRVLAPETDGMQILEVRDTGPGIPPERAAAIFEPFYTSKRQGLGLGLSICRSIVDSFGGRITVESPPEGGAVFRVLLRTFVSGSPEAEQAMKAGA